MQRGSDRRKASYQVWPSRPAAAAAAAARFFSELTAHSGSKPTFVILSGLNSQLSTLESPPSTVSTH